jgi:hypothetical protein
MPCKRRINKSDARAPLTQIGVQQSRVIDVQFPACNTVSFFIRSDFAPTFRAALTKHNFKEKEQLIKEIYNKRMIKLCIMNLVYRPFLAKSIARFLANTPSKLKLTATEFGDLFKSNIHKQQTDSIQTSNKASTSTPRLDGLGSIMI